MTRLDGNVVLVLGDTSGAGVHAIRAVVEAGARVFIAEEETRRLLALIAELGHNSADGVVTDGHDRWRVSKAFERAIGRFGQVDAAVLLANIPDLDNLPLALHLDEIHELHFNLLMLDLLAVMECFTSRKQPGAILVLTAWPPGEVAPRVMFEHLRHGLFRSMGTLVKVASRRADAADLRMNFLCGLGPGDEAAGQMRSEFPADYEGDPTATLPLAVVYLLTEPMTGRFAVVETAV